MKNRTSVGEKQNYSSTEHQIGSPMVSMVKGFTVCLTHSHMLESGIKAIVMPPRETGLNLTKLQMLLLLARLLICTVQRNVFFRNVQSKACT